MHYRKTDHLAPPINLRLTVAQREQLELLAELTGSSVSSLIRQATAEALVSHEQMISAARAKKSA